MTIMNFVLNGLALFFQLGDFAQVESAYLKALEELTAPQDSTQREERTRLKQDLAEFFMDLGLFDAAR